MTTIIFMATSIILIVVIVVVIVVVVATVIIGMLRPTILDVRERSCTPRAWQLRSMHEPSDSRAN